MSRCSRFSERLAQFVADGEPQTSEYLPLQRHLATCPTCREEAVRLRFIEEILKRHPRRAVEPALTGRILAAIAREEDSRAQASSADRRLLTWDIWLPAVTLVLAFSILALSIPEQNIASLSSLRFDPALLRQPVSLAEILPGIRMRGGDAVFWALWSGFFAVVGGIGLWVSLNHWNADSSHVVSYIEGQVSDLVQRLTGRIHQAQ